jgi:hypothetical protein
MLETIFGSGGFIALVIVTGVVAGIHRICLAATINERRALLAEQHRHVESMAQIENQREQALLHD